MEPAAPPCPPLDWQPVWSEGTWSVERAHRVTGTWARTNLRLVAPSGACCITVRADGAVLLVRQDRPAPGVRLWELPRGGAEPGDASGAQTARRELVEETGAVATPVASLGLVYPDSGLLGSHVEAVVLRLDGEGDRGTGPPEVDETRWFSPPALDALVARGELRDAISLAALHLYRVWSAGAGRRPEASAGSTLAVDGAGP